MTIVLSLALSLISAVQDAEAYRRIEQAVTAHYTFHADQKGLARRYYDLWQRLPKDDKVRSQGLSSIEANCRGMITVLASADKYRSQLGQHPVYGRLLVPQHYYRRLYGITEQVITQRLSNAAAPRLADPATRDLLRGQLDAIVDQAGRLAEARITGDGGKRLVREELDEIRVTFHGGVRSPWSLYERALAPDEVAAVLSGIKRAADDFQPFTIDRHPGRMRALSMASFTDAERATLDAAKKQLLAFLKSVWHVTEVIDPESARHRKEWMAVVDEARAHVRDAEALERDTLRQLAIERHGRLNEKIDGERALAKAAVTLPTREATSSAPSSPTAPSPTMHEPGRRRTWILLSLSGLGALVAGWIFWRLRAS